MTGRRAHECYMSVVIIIISIFILHFMNVIIILILKFIFIIHLSKSYAQSHHTSNPGYHHCIAPSVFLSEHFPSHLVIATFFTFPITFRLVPSGLVSQYHNLLHLPNAFNHHQSLRSYETYSFNLFPQHHGYYPFFRQSTPRVKAQCRR